MSAFSSEVRYDVRPIGVVESSLVDLADAPRQGDEGAPEAWLVIDPDAVSSRCATSRPGSTSSC